MTLPGDVRPPLLAQPPGERYRTAAPVPVLERPRMGRGIGLGLLVVAVAAILCALLRAILDLSSGIIVVAVVGGWAIGAAVREGAWGGRPHRPSSAPAIVGACLGALCWLTGLVGAWLVSMATLPASSRTLPERLVALPFLDWLAPQAGAADVLSLLLFVGFGWFGTRISASTREHSQLD